MDETATGAKDEARSLLREAVEALRCNYAIFDRDRRLVDLSASYARLHRLGPEATSIGLRYDDLMRAAVERTLVGAPPEQKAAELGRRIAAHEADDPGEFDRLYPDEQWMRVSKRRLPGGFVAGLAIDITALKEREIAIAASEARYRALIDTAPVGIWYLDERGQTLLANARLAALYGGTSPASLSGLQRKAAPASDGPFGFPCGREVEAVIPAHGSRSEAHVLVCASDWLVASDGSRSTILTLLDITPLKTAQSTVEHLAWHDALTGLGNRVLFTQALEDLAANRQPAVLLTLDLDRFKEVNDQHGHAAGDALLRAVAVRLQMAASPADLACRLGGDEFALLVRGADAVQRGPLIAEALTRELGKAPVIDDILVPTAASIGHATFPTDADDTESLQRAADVALYAAKQGGRGRSVAFNPALLERARRRSGLAAAFQAAVWEKQLKLLWQPQYVIPGNALRGAMAMISWPGSPRAGQSPVAHYYLRSLAADSGQSRALDDWALDAVVLQVAAWAGVSGAPPIAAVAISSASLSDATLPSRVAKALLRHRVDAGSLELELPESVAVADLDTMTPVVQELRALGVRIALDGFGTSAFPILYLTRWDVGLLKLNPAIVAGLPGNEERSAVEGITAMAGALGIPLVADGVEAEAQMFSLRRAGCRLMQGAHFGPALSADDLVPAQHERLKDEAG